MLLPLCSAWVGSCRVAPLGLPLGTSGTFYHFGQTVANLFHAAALDHNQGMQRAAFLAATWSCYTVKEVPGE